jgi:hypothetical protein
MIPIMGMIGINRKNNNRIGVISMSITSIIITIIFMEVGLMGAINRIELYDFMEDLE